MTRLQKLFAAAAWVLVAIIMFHTVGPVQDRPQFGFPNLERIAAYFVAAAAFMAAWPRQWRWIVLGLSAWAVGLEIAQIFIPSRDARVIDAAVKVLGAVAGVGTIGAVRAGLRIRSSARTVSVNPSAQAKTGP